MGYVTAVDVAEELGIDPATFRAWLRELARRGHHIVRNHKRWTRWEFTRDQANSLIDMFLSEFDINPERSQLAVRFRGTEGWNTPLSDLAKIVSTIDGLYRSALPPGVESEGLRLRGVSAGSPFELEVVIREWPMLGQAVRMSLEVLVATLITSAVLRKIEVETDLAGNESAARVRKINEETEHSAMETAARVRQIEQQTKNEANENRARIQQIEAAMKHAGAESEARIRALELDPLRDRPATPPVPRFLVVDRTGLVGPNIEAEAEGRKDEAAAVALVENAIQVREVSIAFVEGRVRRRRRRE